MYIYVHVHVCACIAAPYRHFLNIPLLINLMTSKLVYLPAIADVKVVTSLIRKPFLDKEMHSSTVSMQWIMVQCHYYSPLGLHRIS